MLVFSICMCISETSYDVHGEVCEQVPTERRGGAPLIALAYREAYRASDSYPAPTYELLRASVVRLLPHNSSSASTLLCYTFIIPSRYESFVHERLDGLVLISF